MTRIPSRSHQYSLPLFFSSWSCLGVNVPPWGTIVCAIPPVEVGALDGAVVLVGNAHVGPVDVPAFDIDRDAIGQPALGDDDLAVGAVRVQREHTVAAEVENE